ncbi:hypothetical protein [Glutamicibacter sp. AOP5-A2-18]|uniref:hypothetical protein n=1 Tax=Glutamicibacter sp. AOP5-A2-18 TaxID=3457656 RepID=UPI00403404A3
MQQKPSNWPGESALEIIPEIFSEFHESTWPPKSVEAPQGTSPVGDWSISRQLTGGMLPTQVRGASGHSIASGQVSIPQLPAHMSPWGFGQYRLGPGGRCTVYASQFGGYTTVPDRRIALGEFTVAPISGASTEAKVSLDLDEYSLRLRKPFTLKWTYSETDRLDAAWVVHQVARAGGYYAVPEPISTTLLSFPLMGSSVPDRSATNPNTNVTGELAWADHDGQIGLASGATVLANASDDPDAWYVTLDHNGLGSVVLKVPGCDNITFTVAAASVTATRDSVETLQVPILGAPSASSGWRRIQFQVNLKGFSMRARAEGTSYGAYSSKTWTPVRVSPPRGQVRGVGDAVARGVQFSTTTATEIFGRGNKAKINSTGSILTGLLDVPVAPGWDLLQEIASSTGGAVWMDETGTLIFRSRDLLRGTGNYGETIEALEQVETLGWIIDPADQADRVELTYKPTIVTKSADETTIWESDSPLLIRVGTPKVLFVDIDGTTDRLSRWVPLWDTRYPEGSLSRWAASFALDGSGSRPADDSVSIKTSMVSSSRIKITITNKNTSAIWMVDGNGNPAITLRTSLLVTAGDPVTISKGVSANQAVSPLELSTGAWIQDADAAQTVLHWAASQTEVAQPVLQGMRVVPNLARQLGDLVRIIDPITNLRSKALITGITLNGDHSQYSQELDLTLVAVTFDDWDQFMQPNSLDSFTALDAFLQAQQIRSFNDLDEWGQDFGGTL